MEKYMLAELKEVNGGYVVDPSVAMGALFMFAYAASYKFDSDLAKK